MLIMKLLLLFLSVFLSFTTVYSLSPIVQYIENINEIILENGYVKLVFNKRKLHLESLYSDFNGLSSFKKNLLSKPYGLEVGYTTSNDCKDNEGSMDLSVITKSDELIELELSGIVDCGIIDNSIVREVWRVSLAQASRFADFKISGNTIKSADILYIAHGLYVQSASIYGLFDRGVVQMMNSPNTCFGSSESISRVYWVGNGTALDYVRKDNYDRDIILLSKGIDYQSGLQDIIIGTYPRKSLNMESAWSNKCWQDAVPTNVVSNYKWSYSISLGPNNYNFPIYLLPDAAVQSNIPFKDIQTFLTGIYASPVGCIESYYENRQGTVAPTIAHPDIGYSPNTNFFDPDNYLSMTALLYSGDSYLINQVKLILERTSNSMCGIGSEQIKAYCDISSTRKFHSKPSKWAIRMSNSSNISDKVNGYGGDISRTGQLMHHFINLVPTYESIAGSEQLGPNVFWSLTVLKYADVTGDIDWLRTLFPYLDLSAKFLTTFYDEDKGLLLSPGPLWIDVIVRENYTSDSNAIAPLIFNKLADCYDVLGEDKEFATYLRYISNSIITNMNKLLWSSQDDHYITQINPDNTIRDFIDYDSNLMAVAFGVTPNELISKVVTRVDSGAYTHIRGTWCCEIPYSGDADDCYIVGGSVCGDSIVTLGRIGWVDSHVRKKIGDLDTFENLLLIPLQDDLIKDTWLYERYDSNGNQIRTSFYFEYPSLVSMMLTEIRYGIDITLQDISINPFPVKDFGYKFGHVNIQYSQQLISISVTGFNSQTSIKKNINIYGLISYQNYILLSNECMSHNITSSTNSDGFVQFTSIDYISACTYNIQML